MDEFTGLGSTRNRRRRKFGVAQRWKMARGLVFGLALAMTCQSALAQTIYRIKSLGVLDGCTSGFPTVQDLNNADEVTGQACNAHGDLHAFLWKNDGTPMVDLGPPEVGSTSEGVALNASGQVAGDAQDSTGEFAFLSSGDGSPMTRIHDGLGGSAVHPLALNDLGQITGYADTGVSDYFHAFVWKNNGSAMRDLGTFGGRRSAGLDINASGQVTGWADFASTPAHAFLWKNDGTPISDLGTLGGAGSGGLFINASGQVAGSSDLGGTRARIHAFLWKNDGTPMRDLGTLGGPYSNPTALNDSGQVAGTSYTHTSGASNQHAFVWLNNGTPMKDLGTLGGTKSEASDINASGQVTGYSTLSGKTVTHPFLWRNDGTKMQDLNALIDPLDPLKPYVTFTEGAQINDRSDILAFGTDSRTGRSGPYLLQGTVLTLNPRSLAFGNQPIHTTSAAKPVTVTNTSAKVVAITSIALKGAGSGQFTSTNNCGSSLAGHATCTIKVTFKPTTKGAKSATLNVNGGGGGLRSVTLTGTGT